MASVEVEVTKEILSELIEDKIRSLINKQSDNSTEIANLSQAWMNLQKLDYPLYPTTVYTPTWSSDQIKYYKTPETISEIKSGLTQTSVNR